MKVTLKYVLFWGKDDMFSNFYSCKIVVGDKVFHNGEQYFQWLKARFFKDYKTAEEIYLTSDPKRAKTLGRMVDGYVDKDWAGTRIVKMIEVLRAKVESNPEIKERLLQLGRHHTFVEASPYDKLWGIGFNEYDAIKHEDEWGRNLLGACWDDLYKDITEPKPEPEPEDNLSDLDLIKQYEESNKKPIITQHIYEELDYRGRVKYRSSSFNYEDDDKWHGPKIKFNSF